MSNRMNNPAPRGQSIMGIAMTAIVLCASWVHAADTRLSEAGYLYQKGMELADDAEATNDTQAAGQAIEILRASLEMYQEYLEAYPDQEHKLEKKLIKINAAMFWLAKFSSISLIDEAAWQAKDSRPEGRRRQGTVIPDAMQAFVHQIRSLLQQRRVYEARTKYRKLETAYPDDTDVYGILKMEIRLTARLVTLCFEAARRLRGKSMNFSLSDGTACKGRVERVGMDVIYITSKRLSFPARISMLSPKTVIDMVESMETSDAYLCTAVYKSVLGDPQGSLNAIYRAKQLGSLEAQAVLEQLRDAGRFVHRFSS